MKRVTIVLAVLTAIGTTIVAWQYRSLAQLRHEHALRFVETGSETTTNSASNREEEQEVITLREETRELPKLRNEVKQLRFQQAQLITAREENARLLEAQRAGPSARRATPPGFTSAEQLKNAGYGTPEKAIETFFWAMREGRLDLAIESLSPEHRDRKNFESLPPDQRARQASGFRDPKMDRFSDFTVAQREPLSEDAVVLHVRSSVATNTSRFRLTRYGSEWKLSEIGY